MGQTRATYTHSLDQAYAKLIDPAFLIARAEATGEENITCTVSEEGGDTVIRLKRDMEVDLPKFAKRLLNAKNTIDEVQRWRDGDNGKVGEFVVDITGSGPKIKVNGTFTLAAQGDGSEHIIAYSASAKVPLVGKKLESFIEKETETGIISDFDFNKSNF